MKNITKIVLLCFVVVSGILLFQAQDFNSYKFNDVDPMLDRPTREAFSHFSSMHDDNQQDVITDASGFDTYDIAIDLAEQHVTSNPLVPI